MLRIRFVLACLVSLSASTASADFIAASSPGFVEPAASAVSSSRDSTTGAVGAQAQQLWRSSGYLELGYYAFDGKAAHKHFARPEVAGVAVSRAEAATAWHLGPLAVRASAGVERLAAAVAAALGLAAFAMRRRWFARMRV
jgi:hypothetical protein